MATAGLNDTVTFLTQLLVYIDTLYEKKLHGISGFTETQAWGLATQILDQICAELYAPKEGVQEAMAIDDAESVCSQVLWACFKTHDVMAAYVSYQFENHPTIAAEYTKFLAMNSGQAKYTKLEASVKDQKEDVSSALKQAKSAVAKADVATGKSDSAKASIEALTKRIQALEKK